MSTELPRRAFLGAQLAPDEEAFAGSGLKIVGAIPGSMAAEAELQAGDQLLSLASTPLDSFSSLTLALRRAGAQQQTSLLIERGNEKLTRRVQVQSCPREAVEDQEFCYEQLEVPGASLRTILSYPRLGRPKGAILIVQGISCESVDYALAPDEPLAKLIHGWARAGYMTMRVDKRGVGDSRGSPCSSGDFDTEYSDFRHALQRLVSDTRRQDCEIILFGHSVGGMMAPHLAAELPLAGLMVYGTSTARWLDCVIGSTERQLRMRGMPEDSLAVHLQSLREKVLTQGLNGRSAAYHRQLHALKLNDAWRKMAQTPCLILCGEHDWVLSREEQVSIAALVDRAKVVDLSGLDHMLGFHRDRESSLREYGQGTFRPDVLIESLAWMNSVVS